LSSTSLPSTPMHPDQSYKLAQVYVDTT
jgi:hypothetical protein